MHRRPRPPFQQPSLRSSHLNQPANGHGVHTLRRWKGTIVGIYGEDVFVELGPRMQGVIKRTDFPRAPQVGEQHHFTLRGQEDRLWALAIAGSPSLRCWESMEAGSLVEARVQRAVEGGLQLKVGPLHAFMPRSHCGIGRGRKATRLLGKTITCEVLEVDAQRQRVILSRKAVLQRERDQGAGGSPSGLRVGQRVAGRVTRIESFGIFMTWGRGHEGMVHVSNIRNEHVQHPSQHYSIGDPVEAQILFLRRGGKRIGLGIRQLHEDPWQALVRDPGPGGITHGTVTALRQTGARILLRTGVEAFLPYSEYRSSASGRYPILRVGQNLGVRIVEICPDSRRASLSLNRSNGAPIDEHDLRGAEPDWVNFDRYRSPGGSKTMARAGSVATGPIDRMPTSQRHLGTNLGHLLRQALAPPGREAAS
jgi:small subunit ribosomal protein S1